MKPLALKPVKPSPAMMARPVTGMPIFFTWIRPGFLLACSWKCRSRPGGEQEQSRRKVEAE